MKKALFTLSVVTLFTFSLSAQCSMSEIPLNERAILSDLIIEGKVVAKNSYWDTNHQTIYTANTIEVYKIFKGAITTTKIEILTEGGIVGPDMIQVEPSLKLDIGDIGVFTCENVKRFNVPPGNENLQYEAFGSAQGFVKYNIEEQTASDVFKKYNDIEHEVFDQVLAPSFSEAMRRTKGLKTYKEMQHVDLFNNTNKWTMPLAAPVITNFSPTTITAGTKTVLTINGSGFGTTQGSGTVGFKNANNGGSSYMNPIQVEYLSWSDVQITVHVPADAGTGTIQVTNGTTVTSTGTLAISYSQVNTSGFRKDHINDDGAGGYTWKMYTGFNANASAKASFLRAFEKWRCATYINWQLGATTSVNTIAGDATNVIRFDVGAELPAGIRGKCTVYSMSSCTGVWWVHELDIVFDDGTTWEYGPTAPSGSELDFETVALHELGHGHQLGHVINTTDVMHYTISNGQQKRKLNTNNLDAGNEDMARSIVANACGPGPMVALTSANCVVGISNTLIAEDALSVFPNPNNGVFELSFSVINPGNYTLEITNTMGQLLHKENLDSFAGKYREEIDLRNAIKGIYIITLKNAENQSIKKIIVI